MHFVWKLRDLVGRDELLDEERVPNFGGYTCWETSTVKIGKETGRYKCITVIQRRIWTGFVWLMIRPWSSFKGVHSMCFDPSWFSFITPTKCTQNTQSYNLSTLRHASAATAPPSRSLHELLQNSCDILNNIWKKIRYIYSITIVFAFVVAI
jgi:hypothetical protein